MTSIDINQLTICIKGAGEMATGVAVRLKRAGFNRIFLTEIEHPLAVRRSVSFSEVVYEQQVTIEDIEAVLLKDDEQMTDAWQMGQLPVYIDPEWTCIVLVRPDVIIDATIAKKNLGTKLTDAPLVIGLGPGFTAGIDVHRVVETIRGHDLGRVIEKGAAKTNTGKPGAIGGYTVERILRAPCSGRFLSRLKIGDMVVEGDVFGTVNGKEVVAEIDGVVRGLIRNNTWVCEALKIGDIDPRGKVEYCYSISEKARAIGGAVLEAILGATIPLQSCNK